MRRTAGVEARAKTSMSDDTVPRHQAIQTIQRNSFPEYMHSHSRMVGDVRNARLVVKFRYTTFEQLNVPLHSPTGASVGQRSRFDWPSHENERGQLLECRNFSKSTYLACGRQRDRCNINPYSSPAFSPKDQTCATRRCWLSQKTCSLLHGIQRGFNFR